jgi:hypothetical protein
MSCGAGTPSKTLAMSDADALPTLLRYREQRWLDHCSYVLRTLLIPLAQNGQLAAGQPAKRAAVLIDNRINDQWLFTVLNTVMMCPPGTQLCLITGEKQLATAQALLRDLEPTLEPWWCEVERLCPGTDLSDGVSFNRMMKQETFWHGLPHEKLLIIQTDALLVQPVPEFFFEFGYLGAPFLPRQQSETFERREHDGALSGFFKVDTPIHGSPDPDVYPHLHGNGGLSIRHRSLMHHICSEWGANSPATEMEDVFFSRHLPCCGQPAPLAIAQSFACESTYNPTVIGSHAAWKYFTSAELAEHLDRHFRQTWAMTESHRHACSMRYKSA